LTVQKKTPTEIDAIADAINSASDLASKINIYSREYGLIGKTQLYPGEKNESHGNHFFCKCGNCIQLPDFQDRYAIYEPFLLREIKQLQEKLNKAESYSEKLHVWNEKLEPVSYSFETSEGKFALNLSPSGTEEVIVHNHYYYQLYRNRMYVTSNFGILGQSFVNLESRFLKRYEKALKKDQTLQKEIEKVEQEFREIKSVALKKQFDDLVDGHELDFANKPWDYSAFVSQIIPAHEGYLYYKFLLGFNPSMSGTTNGQPLISTMNDKTVFGSQGEKKIRVFVTYAWEGDEENERVISFTNELRQRGFAAVNDTYMIQQGASTDFQAMMLKCINEADKVIVLLSKDYAKKADKMELGSGVGTEYQLILKDIEYNPNKYILTSFDPYHLSLFPLSFRKRELISLTDEGQMERLMHKLKDIPQYQYSDVADKTPSLTTKPVPAFQFKKKHVIDVTMSNSFDDDTPNVWDVPAAEKDLNVAIQTGDTAQVRKVIQGNGFLLYDIYERKGGALPIFHDIPMSKYIVDFAWLNDASGGPEWVLLHVAEPNVQVLDAEGEVSQTVLVAIETVKAWANYFELHPAEKKRIFGAVAKFKFQLIIGSYQQWQVENAQKWRLQHNKTSIVEIRSYNTFSRAIAEIKASPDSFFRFNQFYHTSPNEKLEEHWKNYGYMDNWRKWL